MAVIAAWQKVYGIGINNLGASAAGTHSSVPIVATEFTSPFNMPGWYIGAAETLVSASTNMFSFSSGTVEMSAMGKGDWWQILPNNDPNLDPGQEIIEKEKALGKPFRDSVEYQAGVKASKTTLEMDVTPEEIIPFLWAFCGSMGQKASAGYDKNFIPYVVTSPTNAGYTLGIWDFLNDNFTTGMLFDDFRDFDYAGDLGITLNIYEYIPSETYVSYLSSAVPASMNFSSAENEALTVSIEFNAHSVNTDTSWQSGGYDANRSTNAALITPLLHQDATFVAIIDATPVFETTPDHDFTDTAALSVKSWSLNASANPGIDHFDSQSVEGIVNQRFSGTHEFQIKWDGSNIWKDAHENNEYVLFNAIWDNDGSGVLTDGTLLGTWAAGDFGIGVVVRVTNCERTNDAQVMENITGEVVTVSTYTPIMFKSADGIAWNKALQS